MLPPKVLGSFLTKHPAGGIPCWLLEVGSETIISLGSLSHYYHYGDTFLPGSDKAASFTSRRNGESSTPASKVLKINGSEVKMFLLSLLASPSSQEEGATQAPDSTKSPPVKKSSSLGIRRRNSNQSDVDIVYLTQSDVMDRLQEISADGGKERLSDGIEMGTSQERLEKSELDADNVTMHEFYSWANSALDDDALDVVMTRLFSSGIIPGRSLELELVHSRWKEWQETESLYWSEADGTMELLTQSVRKLLLVQNGEPIPKKSIRKAFGGIGGFDGGGGTGCGVMYCVDKEWWDSWESYVGWKWGGDESSKGVDPTNRRRQRPGELSTERLLSRLDDEVVAGTLGSYELMKDGLKKDEDYVLIPPGVWDILFEIYGGGPPLPRMVLAAKGRDPPDTASSSNSDGNVEVKAIPSVGALDAMASPDRVLRIPRTLTVATHPWILHFHLCDPQQPYRRGEAGPMSIRVMALPDQPFWRLYSEIIVRLPCHVLRAYGSDGRGRARLWKRTDPAGPKDALSRYGPWMLLCKSRHAVLPILNQEAELEEHYDELKANWQAYGDNASVESIGLADGDQLMLECAILDKNGDFMWPREAAAKAGRVRRLADKDMKFRQMLRGVDDNGELLPNPPDLVGMVVDAMDASGRWYQVSVAQVQTVTAETDEEEDEDSIEMENTEGFGASGPPQNPYTDRKDGESAERKQVRVDFTEHGGHSEWIDVESDRLATAGRFTLGKPEDEPGTPTKTSGNTSNASEARTKAGAQVKKTVPESVSESNGKVCTFPGYGACGLANLGNTCYVNSAVQCISYMPLLRAYLLSCQYKATGDLNKDNPLGTGGKLLEEFAELLRQMWSAKIGEKSPTRFRAQLGKARAQFSGADQQDAQEFLNYMLDVLHEDSNRVRNKPYVEGLEDEWVKRTNLPRVGEEAWRR